MQYPVIPGYEIIGVLGEGGMGMVYLATQLSLGRKVAVKILPPSLSHNESYLLRFRHEAKAAAKIRHPNIVQIYDAGEHNGVYFFIMEYVAGETSADRVARKGKLDEESALLIAESVAVALEYAWDRAQLVHRDIKPDNILIDEDGTVKLSDLGLAKTMDRAAPSITVGRAMIGSPHYCAPEQAQGEENVNCCADIYALGATLYHFLTGRPPFAETPGVSAMVRKLTEYLPDVTEINPAVSDNTARLIEKMLARDRSMRQPSWHAVLDDLDEVIHKRPPISVPTPEGMSTMLRGRHAIKPGDGTSLPAPPGGKTLRRAFKIILTAALAAAVFFAVWLLF
ncbi:MAG: serine/threonine-protein kinase [Kiritimatiellae bacterium]|nr:serine/threonine-protein kinase [Kiritimatiellia bacterium]